MPLDHFKRRDFIRLLGGAASWPLAARAQQFGSPSVGFLNGGSAPAYMQETDAFRHGLSSAGYEEGHNVTIEYRWAEGKYDRLRTLALDLIQRQVAVIFCNGPAVVAAKTETAKIPIVFATSLDPVAAGLVESLSRPGGNLTGATNLLDEIGQKRLELMRSLLPSAKVVVALINPNFPNAEIQAKDLQAAAQALNLQLQVLYASSEKEIDLAFDAIGKLRPDGLIIGPDNFFNDKTQQLAAFALRNSLPTIYQSREFAVSGGLMSYGGIAESYRIAGTYVGRILKGDKPADLPVQQVTKVELIINLKTAKAFGITIPLALLTRADEAIE